MSDDTELKIWLAVRKDIEMPPAKFAVQAGHGFSSTLWLALMENEQRARSYMSGSQVKIVVGVKNADKMKEAYQACKDANLPCAFIVDAGRTVFAEPTATVMAVGPCLRSELPKCVKRLQML